MGGASRADVTILPLVIGIAPMWVPPRTLVPHEAVVTWSSSSLLMLLSVADGVPLSAVRWLPLVLSTTEPGTIGQILLDTAAFTPDQNSHIGL